MPEPVIAWITFTAIFGVILAHLIVIAHYRLFLFL